ncbi:Rne/Rng family ribonuclease [Maribius pontilimi]|uniref:Ribonuclease E n=1 Tax=Palleronia pontilimi TaxID=1964209 RepID=A0A934MAT4_9RHOB|nr:ribonuclease E/G [Palleronia pontilimi]MBJ3763982.1 Rne/Rng family ribonuclease [Palleronia pontilimi]
MAKKMLIDATHAEETRVVVVDGNKVEEFDFESENKRQLAGNIYLAKVTRVEPSLQAAFIDYGGNRHGFLAFSEIHPDYYQIPIADREALLAEEAADAEEEAREEERPKRRSRSRSRTKAADTQADDAVATAEPDTSSEVADAADDVDASEAEVDAAARTMAVVDTIPGMDVIDTAEGDEEETPYVAADDASERDENIESVADDDVTDEVRPRRKPRAKKYKIQEVIKVRQILLVQVVKEERGNKGAALTTYLSLAGRYCVLMPNTARGGGISRKITNAADRKKLKEIATSIEVPKGAGLIVRTAGAKRTKTEIKRDYEYLQRMWEQIRELTLKSIAPAPIYEEGNLIKRSIRDLYNREIDEVLVEGEAGYRVAKDFMKMIMPSHAKNVKNYHDQMPLFARHQVESYLGGMFNPTVQLPSGGYIVIGVTEALVAIDVNSGRATKEGSIEETAYKTNMEAAEEVARQLRLRDLAGLIVIDFIDMEDRKHNANVEKHFKDKLKTDRARIQVGKISGFGLLEMSRQRLRPGMIEATTQPCPHCHGTGLLRSDDNVALAILRQLEEEGTRKRTREICVTAPVQIANYLMNNKRDHIAQIEARYGMVVRIEGDAALVSPDYKVEKFKTQITRQVEQTAAIVSSASMMDELDEPAEVDESEAPEAPETPEAPPARAEQSDDDKPKKRRRRRRRRKSGGNGDDAQQDDAQQDDAQQAQTDEADEKSDAGAQKDAPSDEPKSDGDDKSKRKRSRSRGRKKTDEAPKADPVASEAAADESQPAPETDAEVAERAQAPAAVEDTGQVDQPVDDKVAAQITEDAPVAPPVPEDRAERSDAKPEVAQPVPDAVAEQITEDAPIVPPAQTDDADDGDTVVEDKPKTKKRGWWSLRS